MGQLIFPSPRSISKTIVRVGIDADGSGDTGPQCVPVPALETLDFPHKGDLPDELLALTIPAGSGHCSSPIILATLTSEFAGTQFCQF